MIQVHVNHSERAQVGADVIERAVTLVLAREPVADAEVSVTLLPDDEMRRLNRSYLSHDWPTDVLAFALDGGLGGLGGLGGPGGPGEVIGEAQGEEGLLGDIYIGAERAAEQARERGIGILEEVVRLAIHGALHLLGRDHPEGPDREGSEFFVEQEGLVSAALSAETGA